MTPEKLQEMTTNIMKSMKEEWTEQWIYGDDEEEQDMIDDVSGVNQTLEAKDIRKYLQGWKEVTQGEVDS